MKIAELIWGFQSLSRDSGRLNLPSARAARLPLQVSIPQSGFGAFELADVHIFIRLRHQFQSLSRDSGRLNVGSIVLLPAAIVVSIPQSGFGAFEPPGAAVAKVFGLSFNPSVGIRGV